MNYNVTIDDIISLCKNRGFIYAGSEIYGGLANTWDYGPLGVELKNNIKKAWWKKFVTMPKNNIGLDCGILMNSKVWESSGHIGGFSDPLMDCKDCKTRHRADTLIEDQGIPIIGLSDNQLMEIIKEKNINCPNCGKSNFTDIRKFNLMFKTSQGVTEDTKNDIYLRPETAQGIFINFSNIQRTTRKKIPFGVGQIGKSFRNEITPGNYIFRTREFEQMEMEFFCKPDTELEWFEYWQKYCEDWLLALGIKKESIKLRKHEKEELSHYSNATTDIEFLFPFGWGELWGIASRTDFDLSTHMKNSIKSLEYFDPETNEKYIPYVIEPSLGVERMTLAFLCNAYHQEEVSEGDIRKVLKLHPAIAPIKAAILPLSKKLSKDAEKIYQQLSQYFPIEFDESGSIGKRYRRQDEIGTPFCITFDFESLEDGCVTIRHRDSMKQDRIKFDQLKEFIENYLIF
ncbi:MAG: glycine--tRNA ligase [Oscillospiraceae bacterium]|nr:glycine--tRNA ligase [Oscillospiraceae bacterium]